VLFRLVVEPERGGYIITELLMSFLLSAGHVTLKLLDSSFVEIGMRII